MFVTLFQIDPVNSALNFISTSPCLNLFNGSQIASGYYSKEVHRSLRKKRIVNTYYTFHINGQNPYGFTYSIKNKKIPIQGNIHVLNSKGIMTPYHGEPPA